MSGAAGACVCLSQRRALLLGLLGLLLGRGGIEERGLTKAARLLRIVGGRLRRRVAEQREAARLWLRLLLGLRCRCCASEQRGCRGSSRLCCTKAAEQTAA